jgi:ubiquinol-cytochrome c reductase cytochrome b subunit
MIKEPPTPTPSSETIERPIVTIGPEQPEAKSARERPGLKDWLELRIGWWGFVRKNLDEPMPAGVGWWQTLGNLLLTLLVFQFTTGVVMAMYYSPSPQSAYDSVKHLTEGVTAGSLVRGLHIWGSTAIVVAMVMHTLRVFFWGSYKKPRELTWVFGVLIFQVMLAFSFTGYLLPWDQKAYWATMVGTRIAGTIPVIGDMMMVLIRGGNEVGALTLTRFYAAHVMLLPAALMAFVGIHLYLVRRHHIAGPVIPQKGKPQPFFPGQLFKDAIVVVAGLAIIFALATAFPPGLEAPADPTGTEFAPRPEWYFLGLFELLKIMPAGYEMVATLVIPGLITIGMFALPWIDRSNSRHPAKRGFVIVAGVFVILLIGLMTMKGILETPVHIAPESSASAGH